MQKKVVAISTGDISTHVIATLGKKFVAFSPVKVYFNRNMSAGAQDKGWKSVIETKLSEHGGNENLVKPGDLRAGLYMVEYDFSKLDEAARKVFMRTDDDSLVQLYPNGLFFSKKYSFPLKIEDPATLNHLVISVGPDRISVRLGVRQH